jgi:hypothetical protein
VRVGELQVPIYRIYQLDAAGGIPVPPIELEASNDLLALELAKLLVNGHAVDVWEQARHVGRLRPPPARLKRPWLNSPAARENLRPPPRHSSSV